MSSPTSSASLLLCVLVKSATIQSSDNEYYSYVVLKIDNVKSTTSVVKGQQPNWEQEFYLIHGKKKIIIIKGIFRFIIYKKGYPLQYQQLTNHSHSHFSDDSDYTSDVSYPINTQANLNYPVSSMSQSNVVLSTNENVSSSISTKKPLAFVQPLIRDLHSIPNTSRRSNQNQIQNTISFIEQEPLSYISQPRKLPMNKITDLNQNET
ncbi:unnamed protein product [Rotaria sp. Silwood2]|nr:unnamed protein product [Rotaria sp. Silwood2]